MRSPFVLPTFSAETRFVVLHVLFVMFALSVPASASLGGRVDSVEGDTLHANGNLRIKDAGHYTIYEIKISTWTTVREFVSPAGVVFGVAWEGQFVPDLKQFLGTYFRDYSAMAQAEKSTSFGRRPLRLRLPSLMFETGGHMGSYYGRAYDPELVPEKVGEQEIY
jgi:hypothetical protein